MTKEVLRFVEADWKRRRALPGLKQERDRGGWLLTVPAVALILAVQHFVYAWNPLPMLDPVWSSAILALAIALVLRWLRPWLLGIVRPGRAAQTRSRFVDALLCPACAHDLKGVPPRDDGCTVCPECGAAWRVKETEARSHEGTAGGE